MRVGGSKLLNSVLLLLFENTDFRIIVSEGGGKVINRHVRTVYLWSSQVHTLRIWVYQ